MKNTLLFSFCLIALFTANKVYSQDSYVVNTPTLNVRTEPSTKAEIIGKLASGDVVSIINSSNPDWWKISFYGTEGFVSAKFLITLEASEQYKDWEKENSNTGDNPDCENITPRYDKDLDNQLLIHVGTNADVVVKLMDTYGECIRIAYIKAGDDYSINNIPEGIYYLKIAYGKDFRKYTKEGQCIVKFMRDAVYEKGSEKLDYYKVKKPDTREGDYIVSHWTLPSFELSLNIEFTSMGINDSRDFHSKKISETDFNR